MTASFPTGPDAQRQSDAAHARSHGNQLDHFDRCVAEFRAAPDPLKAEALERAAKGVLWAEFARLRAGRGESGGEAA